MLYLNLFDEIAGATTSLKALRVDLQAFERLKQLMKCYSSFLLLI
jgi:hypothetical protein